MPDPLVPYASGTDLIQRYDVDLIGDLCQDDREELDRASIATHPNVVSALEDASGEIDVALLAGGRYTPEQLSAIADPDPVSSRNNSQKHLIRITCAIAMSILVERRLDRVSMETADWLRKTANGFLEALRRGDNVFGITETLNSGTLEFQVVESASIEALNLLPERANRMFPSTQQRTPRVR